MTPRLLPTLALLLLLATTSPGLTGMAAADPTPIFVDAYTQTVETDYLRVEFDVTRPDMIRQLVYKERDPYRDITSEENTQTEFWGQTLQGSATPGFIRLPQLIEINWQVDQRSDRAAQISTRTVSAGQPPVLTRYWFYSDRPWFVVERTILFSEHPYTGAYQDYLARVSFYDTYRAMRYRDTNGALQQRTFCATPCVQPGWDGRWLQNLSYRLGVGQSVTMIYPSSVPAGQKFVRGTGPNTFAGWTSALWDSTLHNSDETHRVLVAFSTQPDSIRTLDSLWTAFNSGGITLDAPAPAASPSLRLAAAPNPSRGVTQLAWSLPRAQHARVDVLDVSGRRVATLYDADAPAGEMRAAWNGRDGDREAAPGLYWARLTTPDGVRTRTIVRVK